ncbi:hypothetical protein T12_13222 [Trichinella patagoniensis]|uniref:Uncharacterized protein n=1 Tax=Trichinella patagoniensis TaxID=990121 RepID=A0A0V0V2H4_9BILA|nr:hypothetical protein T12_13222 [Trichinella patagoniensis]
METGGCLSSVIIANFQIHQMLKMKKIYIILFSYQ